MTEPIPNAARRDFLRAGLASAAALAAPPSAQAQSLPAYAPSPFEGVTIAELVERQRKGETTAEAIVRAHLERIDALDRDGPRLRSVLQVNPEALDIARELDRERAAGKIRGPLHGIPVMLKDNIPTGDRMAVTAGSLALEGARVGADALVVRRLREAGAVILGKNNLSEWANFRSSFSVSGWSSLGGQTRNPYVLDRSPSGSSSGSAVAVAAGLCMVAIGTETDGSICSPSASNSLVGLKTSIGLVSRGNVIPIAFSLDCLGPMARSVEDCAVVMKVIAAPDLGDSHSMRAPREVDYTKDLGRKALRGVRLGVTRQYRGRSEKADRVIDQALADLKALGAEVVDVHFPTLGKFEDLQADVMFTEFKAGIDQWLPQHLPNAPVKSLADIIAFNERNAARVMPLFGQDAMVNAQRKGPTTAAHYRQTLARMRALAGRQGIDAVAQKHRIDAFVAMTAPPPWLVDAVNGDCSRGGCTSLPAAAGYPHLTVPAGFTQGLPIGISFFGRAFTERKLLAIAHAYEQATRHRRGPGFASTVANA